MTEVIITQSIDTDGIQVISVPVKNTEHQAVLYLQDWQELLELGCNPLWKLKDGHVCQRTTINISIARLVSDARKGERVSYSDGSPFNLKSSNLVKAVGAGKFIERDKLNIDCIKPKVALSYRYINPSWNPNYYGN